MNFNDYQKKARKTAIYPDLGKNIYYPTLGLAGETGEIANKVKKIIRDQKGLMTKGNIDDLAHELGDVLWYVSNLASELKISLNKVALENLKKLSSRNKRKTLHGSGDNR